MNYIDDFFQNRKIEYYERDGILDIEKWEKSKSKILFVLKETAGYEKHCFDLVDEIPKWITDNVPTYIKISKLTYLLELSIKANKILSDIEIDEITFPKEKLKQYINYSAIININKQSVRKRSSDKLLEIKFLENKELLEKQIEEIKPKIIIGASKICWNCIAYKSNGLFSKYDIKETNKHNGIKDSGLIFYYSNHPSAWSSGGFNVRKIYKQIMNLYLE